MSTSDAATTLLRIDARAAADASGPLPAGPDGVSVIVEFQPGSARAFPASILSVGSRSNVDLHEAARSPRLRTISRPRSLLLPGMVNTHTHLDLTHIGPRPHNPGAGFDAWIGMIRDNRLASDADIAASVARGAELSILGGVAAVGDIAGAVRGRASIAASLALAATPLAGVSFIEFFALGARESIALNWLEEALDDAKARGLCNPHRRVRIGVQPHAPYSVSPNAYLSAAQGWDVPFCTHLAESPEERAFIARGDGPLRRMLESLGIWSDEVAAAFGRAPTPVLHARDSALARVKLAAHVNDASDEDLDAIAASGVAIAYCPRASAYFGADRHFGPHRYRDMLARGIKVVLGTDSIVNLPPDSTTRGISIWDEMRFLHARDHTDPRTLLRMGTTDAAIALGLPPEAFAIREGQPIAGLNAVHADEATPDPLAAALRSNAPVEFLFHSSNSDAAR